MSMIHWPSDNKEKSLLKQRLSETFKMHDLGEEKHLLGMKISRDRKSGKVWLDQSTFIKKTLQKFWYGKLQSILNAIWTML